MAPMGPIVDDLFQNLLLRPWKGSTTYDNLCHSESAVFHLVDDVDLIAESAIGKPQHSPPMKRAILVDGWVLDDCCRWLELKITDRHLDSERAEISAQVVQDNENRSFSGFNRAKHAILEAAILATRVHLLDEEDVRQQLEWLTPAVQKTGSPKHHSLFQMLKDDIAKQYRKKVACDAG